MKLNEEVTGSKSVGFKHGAVYPLFTTSKGGKDLMHKVPRGKFINNNIDLFYSDIVAMVKNGMLDRKHLPLGEHVCSHSYDPADYLSGYSVMNLKIETHDARANDVKKETFNRFAHCNTVMDAFDDVIRNVDFEKLSLNCDFKEFITATDNNYVWFVKMLYELYAEQKLNKTTMMCPILPTFDSYNRNRRVGNCFTLDTSSGSYINAVYSSVTDSEMVQKFRQRLDFMTYVTRCSKQGLARCIPDGISSLYIYTLHDSDICVSNYMSDQFIQSDVGNLRLMKVISDVIYNN
jgi:hypothetical protein